MSSLREIALFYTSPDPRSLSLSRLLTGIILFLDSCYRWKDAPAFLSENGIWPSRFVKQWGWQEGYWSLFLWNTTDTWMYVLLSFYSLFSLLFALGWGGKAVQLILWILITSVHNRNLFVLQSGDDLIRIFVFLGMFSRMDVYFSPFRKRPGIHAFPVYFSPGGFFLLILLFCMYAFSVLNKSVGNDWFPDGTALYYALSIDQIRLPAGDLLYAMPFLMKGLTYVIFFMQGIIAILILFPFKISLCRGIAFLMIIILHTGISLTLKVGFFPFISMSTACILIPSSWWNILHEKMAIRHLSLPSWKKLNVQMLTEHLYFYITGALCIMGINLSVFRYFPWEPDTRIQTAIHFLRLEQYWRMFSPDVPRDDGWIEAWGRRPDGSIVVLMSPEKNNPGYKIPNLHTYFPTDRWRKFTENLSRNEYTFLRPLYCSYLIRKFSSEFKRERLCGIELNFFREKNLPDYKTTPLTKELWCYCIP